MKLTEASPGRDKNLKKYTRSWEEIIYINLDLNKSVS